VQHKKFVGDAEIVSNFLAVSVRFIRSEEIRNDFNRSFQTEDLLRLVPKTFRNCRHRIRVHEGVLDSGAVIGILPQQSGIGSMQCRYDARS
jgi:hypothetical protein